MRIPIPVLCSLFVFFSLVTAVPAAHAFCRTTACPLPPDFAPSPDACYPTDFDKYCASLNPPAKPLVLWWRNACVGYDIQKDASRQISYDTAAETIARAFSKWTSSTCGTDGTGNSRVTIDVRDLGPADCTEVQYNTDQGNQHLIVFRDDNWPHNDPNNTLALTTVYFSPDTGELYDADMEINSTIKLTSTDPVPPDGYDFESVVTHETGHFLGMAHSGDSHATMFAHYNQGTTAMRTLTDDDVNGICTIYPPDFSRAVDKSVSSTGKVQEDACDPTPRHGFSTSCGTPPKKGCAIASERDAPAGGAGAGAGAVIAAAACVRAARRRRGAIASRS